MGFLIPTLPDLATRAREAFRAYLPGTDAWLWPNNINPSAKVIAGVAHEVFGFADYIARQKFALTADSENLDRHAEELGLARKPAEPASGKVTLTATEAITVDAGALFRRADGIEYRALAAGLLGGPGTLDLDVIATTDGKTTTAIGGAALEIVEGVTGDATAAVHADGIAGGADIEDDDALRARVLFRKRNPPHGGSPADYVLWALSLSGVTRVFVERRHNGAGTVRVFPLMDDLYANGIPPVGEIARVQDYIDTVAPAAADVTVAAPVAVAVNITITDIEPDTTAIRDAVTAELRASFRRLSRVAGGDVAHGAMPYLAVPTTFSRSWIWQAVANATGEERHAITAPAADVALTATQIATLGTITFA